jgi:hypothetical protein
MLLAITALSGELQVELVHASTKTSVFKILTMFIGQGTSYKYIIHKNVYFYCIREVGSFAYPAEHSASGHTVQVAHVCRQLFHIAPGIVFRT